MPRYQSIRDRLDGNSRRDDNGCLRWMGLTDREGYGRVGHEGRNALAHRVAYIIHVGEIPDWMNVNHTCDVRDCIAVEHLYVGTQAQNVQDMIDRGHMKIGGGTRKDRCHRGHDDWHEMPSGRRRCRTCYTDYRREWRKRRAVSG